MRAYFLRNGVEVVIPLERPNPELDKVKVKATSGFKKLNSDIKKWVADGKPIIQDKNNSTGKNILSLLKLCDKIEELDPKGVKEMKVKHNV